MVGEGIMSIVVVGATVVLNLHRHPVGTGPDQGAHHIKTIVIDASTEIDLIALHVIEEDIVIMTKTGIVVDQIETTAPDMDPQDTGLHLPCVVDRLHHLRDAVVTATIRHHIHPLTITMVPIAAADELDHRHIFVMDTGLPHRHIIVNMIDPAVIVQGLHRDDAMDVEMKAHRVLVF